jgi:hypothetical protein
MNHPASTSSLDDLDVGALRATQSDCMNTASTIAEDNSLLIQSQKHLDLGLADSVAYALATDIAKLLGQNNAHSLYQADKRLDFIERSKNTFKHLSLSYDKAKFQGSDMLSAPFISKLVEDHSQLVRDSCLAKLAEEEAWMMTPLRKKHSYSALNKSALTQPSSPPM